MEPVTCHILDANKKIQTVCSRNGACLVGKMIPHPVGVFSGLQRVEVTRTAEVEIRANDMQKEKGDTL